MTDIQKYRPNLGTALVIFEALQSELIKDTSDAELYEILKSEITASFTHAGYQMVFDGSDYVYFIISVLRDLRLMQDKFAFRKGEIAIAFSRGIRKEYGDFIGLPVVRFGEFMKGYWACEDRRKALEEKNRPTETKPEPSASEKFQVAKGNAIRAYKDVKAEINISLYAGVVYDFLDGLKLIEFTVSEKKVFFEEAKTLLIRDSQIRAGGKVDVFELKKIKKRIEDLQNGGETDLIKVRAKYLALVSYLNTLIFEDVNLEDLINEAYNRM